MNIVQVSTFERSGGAAIAAARLHAALGALGHVSTMLVRERTPEVAALAGVQILPAGRLPSLSLPAWHAVLVAAYRDGRVSGSDRLFSTDQPTPDVAHLSLLREADIVHVHWAADMWGSPSLRRVQDLGVPLVWTLHDQHAFTGGCHYSGGCDGYARDCSGCPWLRPELAALPAAVLARKQEWIDPTRLTIVSPSRWLAACASRSTLLRRARIEVIPNGVPVQAYRRPARDEARRRLALPADAVIVLVGAARLEEQRKGHGVWLEAMRLMLRDLEVSHLLASRRLVLAAFGDGPLIEQDVPIVRLGRLDGDEAVSLGYRAADLFMLPTLEDNLPNTLIEALAAGTPVLAFDTGGVPDVLAAGGGVLVPTGDVEALAAAARDLILDPARRASLAAEAVRLADDCYDVSRQAATHVALYEDLRRARSSPRPASVDVTTADFARTLEASDRRALARVVEPPAVPWLVEHLASELDGHQALIAARGGEIAALRAHLHEAQAALVARDGRLAELEAALAARAPVDAVAISEGLAGTTVPDPAAAHPATAVAPPRCESALDWLLALELGEGAPTPLQGPGVPGLVSVVVPAYNAEAFLPEAIASVWDQTCIHHRIEILVVDDGSRDGTLAVARDLAARSPVVMQVLTHPGRANRGVSASRNLALTHARGDCLALLDADDAYAPERLARGMAYLEATPHCDAVCSLGDNVDATGATVIGANGSRVAGAYAGEGSGTLRPPFDLGQLWNAYPIANSSLLIRRLAWQAVGGYPEDMAHQAEDWLLCLKLAARAPIHCLDERLIRYRTHPDNYTTQYHQHAFETGARLEVLQHLVYWMLGQPDLRDAGRDLFRRHYPLLFAHSMAGQRLVAQLVALAGDAPADVLAAWQRERAELELLRRVTPAALRHVRDLRAALAAAPVTSPVRPPG